MKRGRSKKQPASKPARKPQRNTVRTVSAAHRARARETQQALQATLPVLLDTAPDCILVVNRDGRIVLANARVENMFGYPQEELLGQPIEILLPARFRKIHPQHREGYFAAPRTRPMGTDLDLVGLRKDGSEFPVDITLGPLKTEEGLLVISVIRDITERKQAKETLRESEEKYRTIIQSIEDGYYEVDIAGNFTFLNDSLCRILGYPPGELMGVNNRQYADAETSKQVYQAFNKVFRSGQPRQEFNWPIIRKDGKKAYIDTSIHLIRDAAGNPAGFRGIVRDITERKRAGEALRKSEERFRSMFEATAIGVAVANMDGCLMESNRRLQEMLGYSGEELHGTVFTEFTHPEDATADMELYKELIAGKRDHYQMEKRYIRKDGRVAWGRLTVSLMRSAGNEPQFAIGMVEDITERKRAEEALRQTEEKYRGIFEEAIVGIFQTTPEGRYLSVNPALARLYGYESPEELMTSVTDIGHQIYVDASRREEFKRLIEEQGVVQDFEYEVHDKNGRKIWLLENSRAIRNTRGTVLYYVGTVEDITERRRTEEALREGEASLAEAQRMSHVGS